jgi:2-dehydro-3-deoxyphosphogluconate aldolase/(4S)-4-hydroxy-2-oxoglutarate aldolase
MPWASIMPTGGVSPDETNLKGWFKAGVHCVGMGSQLLPKNLQKNGDYGLITTLCRDCLTMIQKLKLE